MTKKELVSAIAEKSNLKRIDAERALNAFVSSVTEALASGERIQLSSFGTFEVRERKAHQGRNPQTKEIVIIPATKVPAFRPCSAMKAAVSGK